MLQTLRRPRSLALTLAVVLMVALFWRLGLWQWHRAAFKRAQASAISTAAKAAPVPASQLLQPGKRPPRVTQWRRVTLTGTYDAGHTVLLRNRTLDGERGSEILVPLVPDTGGPALLVDRGFVASGASASEAVDVPPPPTGTVTAVARVRLDETVSASRLRFIDVGGRPTVGRLDVSRIADRLALPYPVLDAYAELLSEDPPAGDLPARQEPDEPSDGLNLAYAVQWWFFCLVAAGGWWVLLRQDSEDEEDREESEESDTSAIPEQQESTDTLLG